MTELPARRCPDSRQRHVLEPGVFRHGRLGAGASPAVEGDERRRRQAGFRHVEVGTVRTSAARSPCASYLTRHLPPVVDGADQHGTAARVAAQDEHLPFCATGLPRASEETDVGFPLLRIKSSGRSQPMARHRNRLTQAKALSKTSCARRSIPRLDGAVLSRGRPLADRVLQEIRAGKRAVPTRPRWPRSGRRPFPGYDLPGRASAASCDFRCLVASIESHFWAFRNNGEAQSPRGSRPRSRRLARAANRSLTRKQPIP